MLKTKHIDLIILALGLSIASFSQDKPNVIFILADDLGYMDVSYNGSTYYETPNLDALAKRGMKFTHAYAAGPVCSPTRGSIISGKYPATSGYTGLSGQVGRPTKGKLIDATSLKNLPLSEITLAEALKKYQYNTCHIGKWHCGDEDTHGPLQQGFDSFTTGFEGAKWIGKRFRQTDNKFITDHLTDEAIQWIDKNNDAPFFLNLWYYAVHTPVKAKEKDIAYFKEKAVRMGLDTINAFEKGENYPANPWYDKNKTNQAIKRRIIQSDPVYAAFVYCLDYNIGRLVSVLDQKGLMDNTILVFFSDNGGLSSAEGSPTCNAPLREGKGWMYEGALRVPCFVIWDGKIKAAQTSHQPIASTDFYPTILNLSGLKMLPKQHVDGYSFKPLLTGDISFTRKPIYYHSPHYFNNGSYPFKAIIADGYKYVYNYHFERAELYNLSTDPEEKTDIINKEQDKAAELNKMLDDWLKAINPQYPVVNVDYVH